MFIYRRLVSLQTSDYRRDVHKHDHHHSSHHHGHSHVPTDGTNRSFAIAFFSNLGFAVIEIIGGLLTNSLAVTADAIHDLGDTLSIGFAWGLEKFSKRESDLAFNFGYRRFSLIAALFSGIVISCGAIGIGWVAIARFSEPRNPMTLGMAGLAILGILVNGFGAIALGKNAKGLNQKMLTWHLLEDLFGWIIVLIGAIVMHFTGWNWIDPLLAVALSIFVLWNVTKTIKETLFLLLQGRPRGFCESEFLEKIRTLEGIALVDSIRIWSLDGSENVLSLRIHVHSVQDHQAIEGVKSRIREIASQFAVQPGNVTIETCLVEDKCF